jgi:hypothetical protein
MPALIVLLLALIGAASGVQSRDRSNVATGTATFGAAVMGIQTTAVAPRAELRLLVKRHGQWSPTSMLLSGCVPAPRLTVPAGWWVVARCATTVRWAVHGEGYEGRAPPVAG